MKFFCNTLGGFCDTDNPSIQSLERKWVEVANKNALEREHYAGLYRSLLETLSGANCQTERQKAEHFAAMMLDLIMQWGGSKSTAHQCAAFWWKAIENGEFGQ